MDTTQQYPVYSRRVVLRGGILATVGMVVGDRLWAAPATQPTTQPATSRPGATQPSKAKSVIQIWMWGGPPHLDIFDPKPQAGYDYCGPLDKPIPTNVDGVVIGQLLPLLAQQADKYSLIRSMTHGMNGHETAAYMVQTGRSAGNPDAPASAGNRIVFPSIGAVVSYYRRNAGYNGMIPPYVVLTQLQGRFSEAGFLGPSYKPFATGGDPARERFAVEGIIAEGITDQRQRSRRDLLHNLNTLGKAMKGDPRLEAMAKCEAQAYDMILGDAGKVFDLSQENKELRDRYGRNTFGQSCLMARRLVEIGVPYITINYPGWDTHKENFQIMRRKLPEMDAAMATLLVDLSQRGLLDSTIIWWSGEFGRTPRVQWESPWNGGRNHFGQVFSALVAGGGFRGGYVVGSSDAKGEAVKDRPVYPRDVLGSIYQQLDIDLAGTLRHPQGEAVPLMPAASEGVKSGGLLTEIM